MSLTVRRILLFILSVVAGVAGLFGTLALLNLLYGANVDLERYGTVFAVTTAVPLGLLAGLWLDRFMGTNLLPDGLVEQEDE